MRLRDSIGKMVGFDAGRPADGYGMTWGPPAGAPPVRVAHIARLRSGAAGLRGTRSEGAFWATPYVRNAGTRNANVLPGQLELVGIGLSGRW